MVRPTAWDRRVGGAILSLVALGLAILQTILMVVTIIYCFVLACNIISIPFILVGLLLARKREKMGAIILMASSIVAAFGYNIIGAVLLIIAGILFIRTHDIEKKTVQG